MSVRVLCLNVDQQAIVFLNTLNGRITTVPVHGRKSLPTGTLKSILRDLEITNVQFREMI
ncbi:MAG: type II toxin-antitoxin system HicA family toxin [Patescibacteria group bacterium]|nr:type II toxin-antitoxin system HicA family toxin [Patescibacteria group bacterium]